MLAYRSIAHRSCIACSLNDFRASRAGQGLWLAGKVLNKYLNTRFIASVTHTEAPAYGELIDDYLKERQLSLANNGQRLATSEGSHLAIQNSLDILSRDLDFTFDLLDPKPIRNSRDIEDFVLSAPRYPKGSFSTDGHINASLAKRGNYNDFIREARHFRAEEVALSLRLHPARRSRGRIKDESKLRQLQRSLDDNLTQLIEEYSTGDLTKMLRQMFTLGLSIKADHLSDISRRLLKGLHSMSCRELMEMSFLLRSYAGSSPGLCRFALCAIEHFLETFCGTLLTMPPQEILPLIIPMIYMQIYYPSTQLSVFSNESLVNHLVVDLEKLDASSKADLFTLLTLCNATARDTKISEARKTLAVQLEKGIGDVSDVALERLLGVSEKFASDFHQFSSCLYKHCLTRSKTMKPTVLASAYLKLTNKTDTMRQFEYDIGKRFVEVSTPVLVELYCRFLQDGCRSIRQQQQFEKAFLIKCGTLSMRDMSTLLMYQSMHGRRPSALNDIIKQRFLELKAQHKITNDEVLDVVLSMSTVGMHNDLDIWTGIDLPHLVYSTPPNILVYLGYGFLITGQRNKTVWNILLERMLYESKTYTAEAYEVLKVTKTFGILGADVSEHLTRRASWVMQQTKSQHYAKLARQRHQASYPIEKALDLIGLPYSKGVILDELYEAPFYIKSHKIILDPLRESYLHRTTGLEVGEAHLRHSVWRKQGYSPYPLNEYALRKFQTADSGDWNIQAMSSFISKVVKLDRYSPLKTLGRVGILRTRKHYRYGASALRMRDMRQRNNQKTLRRLQKLILDKTQTGVWQ